MPRGNSHLPLPLLLQRPCSFPTRDRRSCELRCLCAKCALSKGLQFGAEIFPAKLATVGVFWPVKDRDLSMLAYSLNYTQLLLLCFYLCYTLFDFVFSCCPFDWFYPCSEWSSCISTRGAGHGLKSLI